MGTYVESSLIKDEKIVHEAKISAMAMLPLILLGLITLPILGLGLIFFIIAFIQYKTTEMAITNKRVIAKVGLIGRRTIEMNLNKVETIQVIQGMFGRIFNYGTIVVSGAGNPQAPIPGITDPMAFRKIAMETQDAGNKKESE